MESKALALEEKQLITTRIVYNKGFLFGSGGRSFSFGEKALFPESTLIKS
jgi:hypothetical protein